MVDLSLPSFFLNSDGISLSMIKANNIQHRTATSDISNNKHRPLVMLLHGWPESWYSWRHQLILLAANGYHVCAPDMRGYGGTESPANVLDYDVHILVNDVVGIASKLGYEKFIVVGHDFGSYLAWHVALLCPDNVIGVCGMSVPYVGHSSIGPLTHYQNMYGSSLPNASRQERLDARFHYILHHCIPKIDTAYDKNAKEALYRLYAARRNADNYPGTPEIKDKHMFLPSYSEHERKVLLSGKVVDACMAPGFWKRLPRPKSLPHWLTKDDFDYYVSEYQKYGFSGGLKWYRALNMNWEQTYHLKGTKIQQPSLFLAGGDDNVINAHGGQMNVIEGMKEYFNNANDNNCTFYKGCGHWIQQEIPDVVNLELLQFLDSLASTDFQKLRSSL